jgi:predicted nucleic acid-binding Zn ribbon protein
MTTRRSPRRLGAALGGFRSRAQPKTLLAAVQSTWPSVAGAKVAAESQPVAERGGIVTVSCRSATWAQELDLLQSELLGRLAEALENPTLPPLCGLRFTADGARHFSA